MIGKIISFFILIELIFSLQYTYVRKNSTDPLVKIPICIGENQENVKCSEISIDLTYPYILISPNFYYDKSINDVDIREDYTQEFIDYNYYFYKGIKYETNFFIKEENIYIKGNNSRLNYLSGFQDINKLGLGINFEEDKILDDGNHNFSKYNFINYLYKNNFIKDYVFSFEPKSKTETLVNIGEKISTDYNKCFSSNKLVEIIKNSDEIEEKGYWNCLLNDITIDNSEKHFLKGDKNYAVFDSISQDIHLPYDSGMDILNYINDITGKKCYFEEKSFSGPSKKEYSYTYLVCSNRVNMKNVSDLKFIFEGFELKMGKNVLISPYDCTKKRVNILAYKNLRYIRIGVPILKKYHIVFDYKDNSVGIIQDKSYLFDELKSNSFSYYCIVILILIILVILFTLRIKSRKLKNSHLIDYNSYSNELEFN